MEVCFLLGSYIITVTSSASVHFFPSYYIFNVKCKRNPLCNIHAACNVTHSLNFFANIRTFEYQTARPHNEVWQGSLNMIVINVQSSGLLMHRPCNPKMH